jgi:hypothetical protein
VTNCDLILKDVEEEGGRSLAPPASSGDQELDGNIMTG